MKRLIVWVLTAIVGSAASLLASTPTPPVQTPEPATMILLAAGAAGVGIWRWRASKK
jgi:hypothetical protein